mmetsp:Transcript_7487/g.13530  ORF Transcript_7487/g.13530 Transcript_7487/m.13530 type:complete len:278 (-) Transcript_7487:751-1584(-)
MTIKISGIGKMESDISRANVILESYLEGNSPLPSALLERCYGICFLFYSKAGFFWSGGIGTGFLVTKLSQENSTQQWSIPSAITATGVGYGFQFGFQKIYQVIFLNSLSAVAAFQSHGKINLGAETAISFGPFGRTGSVHAELSPNAVSASYSFALSKGAFVGINLDTTLVTVNALMNRKYYQDPVKLNDLLNANVSRDIWSSKPEIHQLFHLLNGKKASQSTQLFSNLENTLKTEPSHLNWTSDDEESDTTARNEEVNKTEGVYWKNFNQFLAAEA